MSTLGAGSQAVQTNRRGINVPRQPSPGAWLVAFVSALLLFLVMPVLLQGGLLADDYVICMRPAHMGYAEYLNGIWQDSGVVRPARFIELLLIWTTCTAAPYGLAMLVPLALKFAAGFLLLGLLRDLHVPSPWSEVGMALWLLEPVGTEAALWPAALHVPLGLCFALAALLLYRKGRFGWATLASLCAALSVEQMIFALPLGVWLITPQEHRRRATVTAAAVMIAVVLVYATWPGQNERQALTLAQRWQNVLMKREWYVFYPATGLGLYSGALAFLWAFPSSVAIVLGGAIAGGVLMPRLLRGYSPTPLERRAAVRGVAAVAVLLFLVNLPLIVTDVGYTPRTFTPTWLVLSGAVAAGASRVPWRRPRLLGILSGTAASFFVLSIALSVSVRVRTDGFNRAAAQWIADRTRDGAVVAVCDVERTVVEPAPLGSFHLHAFHSASADWIEHLTGRVVELRRSGERYWGARCPETRDADLVVSFPALVSELVPAEDR